MKCAISARLNYRLQLLTSLLVTSVEVFASIFLWRTLFQEQAVISGYNWNDMIIYCMLSFILNAMLGYSTERNISRSVLDGSISMDLIKPISYQSRCLFQSLGSAIVDGAVAIFFGVLIMVLLCDVGSVLTISGLLLFLVSMILSFLVKFCVAYIAGLCCFFTSNGFGIIYMRQVITDVFSGALLPLSFYPLWFQKTASVLPFQSIIYTPTQIFLGRMGGQEALQVILLQVLWVVLLWIFAHYFFRFAVKKITIQGG